MKLLAETTGEFMLVDSSSGESIPSSRPAVITVSQFYNSRIALNQVVKVSDVPDEASDEEFQKFWEDSDGDRDLAVASFLSSFDAEAPKPKGRGK